MSTTAENKEVAIYVMECNSGGQWSMDFFGGVGFRGRAEARRAARRLNKVDHEIRYRAAKYIRVEEDE